MDKDVLIALIGLGGAVIVALISAAVGPSVKARLERAYAQEDEGERWYRRFMGLRERYNVLKNRCLRRAQHALHLMEQGKPDEAYRLLLGHARELEADELPPVEDER